MKPMRITDYYYFSWKVSRNQMHRIEINEK